MSYPTFEFSTTADEVAEAFADQIKGKNVLITGTSLGGLGWDTALSISRYANLVIITGYNDTRIKAAADALKEKVPTANIRTLKLDLTSLASVRAAAAEVNAYSEPLHVLIHNAAAIPKGFEVTEDGFESQYAVAHFGPFLLTKLLAPKLLAASTADYTPRVVYVSSFQHAYGSGVNFDALKDANVLKDGYALFPVYQGAKSAMVLTAGELSRRSKGKINAYSICPGGVVTNIHTHKATDVMKEAGILDADGKPSENPGFKWKTIPQGASTTLVAAFDPRFEDKPGAFLQDCNDSTSTSPDHSRSPAIAERLWNETEEILGEKFTF